MSMTGRYSVAAFRRITADAMVWGPSGVRLDASQCHAVHTSRAKSLGFRLFLERGCDS
jgi:hypothetical protein